jgi:predicted nucleotidyltransferase
MIGASTTELATRLGAALAKRPEVLDAYLFGSHARGEAHTHSDVDVAVYVDPAIGVESGFGYAAELTSALMTALATNRIDVVLLNTAPPLLYHRVLRDGVRVLSRELAASTTREGMALSRYCDFVPQLSKVESAAAARLRDGEFGR